MEAIRIKERLKKDGEIQLMGLPFKKGQIVEMIMITGPAKKQSKPSTARKLLTSGLVGLWKGYAVGDSSLYARALREKAQKRDIG